MIFKELIFAEFKITLSQEQLMQFDEYYQLLITHNKITNLTRITDKDDVYIKHFLDSLTISKDVNFNVASTICDLGTGAGFPGIPLKIVFPKITLTLVDSLGKRISFLNKLASLLKLENVKIINSRAEDYALEKQNHYDLVISRAFSKLPVFLEIATPMTKENGFLVAMKGNNFEEELKKSRNIMHKLQVRLLNSDSFELPLCYGRRTNLVFQKMKHIQGYPRKYATIIKEIRNNDF